MKVTIEGTAGEIASLMWQRSGKDDQLAIAREVAKLQLQRVRDVDENLSKNRVCRKQHNDRG